MLGGGKVMRERFLTLFSALSFMAKALGYDAALLNPSRRNELLVGSRRLRWEVPAQNRNYA